ncbi:MAG: PrsW family intramembrane metalloprotease [Methanomicrobiales archaeon]|nr:PrsW family intramembrane metalloprotease [Methanomicrobiales archaeon]
MGVLSSVLTIARWEVKRSFTTLGRNVLPVAVVLFLLLMLATGFTARSGMHLQDGIYSLGIDDPGLSAILGGDARFRVFSGDSGTLRAYRGSYDLVIVEGAVLRPLSERGRAAEKTLERDYARYVSSVYNREQDLFAAYPLWIDLRAVKSELSFDATQSGQYLSLQQRSGESPVPEGTVAVVATPAPQLPVPEEALREGLMQEEGTPDQLRRYTGLFSQEPEYQNFRTPSQLSPPLPFDSIIFVFAFIFPLYFTSQFFMMSVMHERIERKGEVLLASPVAPSVIIAGKMLPYLLGMVGISTAVILAAGAPLTVLLPLFPVILFFLASALLIGMISRSFKELSFISIFFSTVATTYLFFPSIFAQVHVISLISPLTLIVLQLQGEGFTAGQYMYSTALFYLTSGVLFFAGTVNFNAERLFSELAFFPRVREFIAATLSRDHPFRSVFLANILLIPFIFMVQMMALVLFFNLPLPWSLLLLIGAAAFIEEFAKSIGVYTLFFEGDARPGIRTLVLASAATGAGFLVGEKLFLFAMLTQITDSVFGSVLFLQQGVLLLWLPLLLHITGVLAVSLVLRAGGKRWYLPGLLAATVIHGLYNLYFILGWMR